MSIQSSEEERSGWTEREGGGRGLGQKAVMRLQPLNTPARKRKVTNPFILKIASKFIKSQGLSAGL